MTVAQRTRLWLEHGGVEHGGGYWLRDAATGDPIRWDDARNAEGGFWVVKVAGASHRLDALRADAFDPGRPVALVPEPDNPHDPNAIGIWDEERRLQAGYVPAALAPELAAAGDLRALALFEWWDELHDRIGLRVLVTRPEVWVATPR